ncbi:conserved exported protein of unknown function [Sterolibacterium denitrificans]|uniref:General secretion pathway protein GspD n=1 Tax=Sterolibacterium denitrificans TaxID=157592 RepID=A0A7Z7HSV5_9PROT|nr:type II secretion system secretin GspD [Sterolibacterium denitrificans]SMB25951.1 conserved exported protein of unknown function [Sterolibacterium denitrificans]
MATMPKQIVPSVTGPRRRRAPLAALLLISCLWLGALPLMPTAAHAEEDKVTLNFVNADIETVTKAVAQITGKSFLLDPRVKGTVNVVSSRPVPQSLAYHYLLSALRMQGFAAVESNNVVRIMPEADAKTHAGPTQRGLSGDQLVTRVFSLRHETAGNMVAAIRPLVAPNNPVSANPGSNSLVISDYADNLNRLEKIIAALDTPYGTEPQIIAIQHGSAIDLANTLNRIYGSDGGNVANPQQRVSIHADTRSNALIVRSDNPTKLSHVRSLITSLDQPSANSGNIHVVYLKNAEAVKVAQTLRAIVSNDVSAASSSAGASPATAPLAAAGSDGNALDNGLTGAANFVNPVNSTNAAGNPSAQTGGFIQADASNNALIITAPEPVYNNLRQVIDMLDRRRAQVLVEALIVELTSDRASELGVQWLGGSVSSGKNTAVVGGTNFGAGSRNLNGFIENLAQARNTGTLGLAPGLNLGIISDPAGLGVLVRALENDANANILSTPNLLTLDNEEAKIVIGSNVPFISGQYAATGNSVTATPFQTYERKDVGLMLKVRPQISEGGLVRLQIYQEASSIQENTLSNVSGPSTNKRSIETSVVVDDGATIVIGGLIQDSAGAGKDKVPLLGDIPVVGSLFRYETRKRTKTNLMVFLRPQIVRDAAGYRKLTGDRYDYVIGEQKKAAGSVRLMANETAPPLLPKLNQALEFSPAASPQAGE